MVHPIVAQMEPSPEQLPAITKRACDLLVTAGAGSGKTRTLVARYLDLLADGAPLRSVVAITFTRKAAREMRNRVRLQVQRYLEYAGLPPDEHQRWQELYSALDAARISTIHSLCTELLRAHPAEPGLDPRFEVLDEARTGLLRKQAVDDALAWAANEADVSGLFALLGERDLRDLVASLLGKRLDVRPLLASGTWPWAAWQEVLIPPLRTFVEDAKLQACFEDLVALRTDGTLARALTLGDDLAPYLQRLLDQWDALCAARQRDDWVAVSACLQPMRDALKQKGKKGNWAEANPKQTIAALQELYDLGLPDWLQKGNLALDRLLADAMPAIGRLFAYVEQAYDRLRGERNALDFDDLEDKAVTLLQEHVEVLARWQEEVQAILVDEFQDTNRRQLALVEALNGDRRRVFCVGDPKQSIYRFRGAEVSLFQRLKQQADGMAGEHDPQWVALPLQTSYRPHKELLAGLNALLRPALGVQAEQDLLEYRQDAGPGFASPYIELHLTVGTKSGEDNALERAARALAGRLAELAAAGLQVLEDKTLRPLGYGDMAILCRATASFAAYEDALDRAGIPFLTVAGRGFYQRPEIRDLLNALRALADPTDDLALAGLLCSPVMGLYDATLYHLCRQRQGTSTSLWQVLQGPFQGLEAAQEERARRATRLIGALHGRAGRSSVADLLKAFIDETGYRAAFREAHQGRAARNIAKLLADAHASGIVSVGEFLEYVTLLQDAGTREGEARATSEGAVQIMTVHAAKGLEFSIVVLEDINAQKRPHNDLLLDPTLGLLLSLRGPDEDDKRTPAIYRRAKAREDELEHAESARLLYVAATRAREMLLVSGHMALTQKNCLSRPGEWLDWLAGSLGLKEKPIPHQETGQSILRMVLSAGETPVACFLYEPGCPLDHVAAAPPLPDFSPLTSDLPLLVRCGPRVETVEDASEAADLGRRVWQVVPDGARARAPQWVVGQLVHEALAAWRFPEVDFEAWAEARARALGLIDPRALQDAVSRSAGLLQRFRRHELYQEMDSAERRLSEVPYSRRGEDGCTDNGLIDALYRRAGQWTIVEFKTDHVADAAEMKQILETQDYLQQAERYVRAVEQLLEERPRHVFCWLDYGGKVVCEPKE